MDVNIILGLGLYTIIGVAPLIYNYYVVNKKHATSSGKVKVEDGRVNINNHLPSRAFPLITPINRGIGTSPIIVFVLNKNNLEDPEIRRLIITYLMRGREEEEATAIAPRRAPLELGVRDIESAEIQVVNAERMVAVEA